MQKLNPLLLVKAAAEKRKRVYDAQLAHTKRVVCYL